MWILALLAVVTAIAVALAAHRRRTALPPSAQRLNARIEPHL